MSRTKSQNTVADLRAKAKTAYAGGKGNRALKGYSKMKKAELEEKLGVAGTVSATASSKPGGSKFALGAKRYESAKQSKAIAYALKKKLGLDETGVGEIEQHLRGEIKKAVDQRRKQNPNASDQDLRAVAVGAVKSTIAKFKKPAAAAEGRSPQVLPRNQQQEREDAYSHLSKAREAEYKKPEHWEKRAKEAEELATTVPTKRQATKLLSDAKDHRVRAARATLERDFREGKATDPELLSKYPKLVKTYRDQLEEGIKQGKDVPEAVAKQFGLSTRSPSTKQEQDKHPHEMTPKQFHEHHIKGIMTEFGISRGEAESSLIEPTGHTHARLVIEAARDGKQIPHGVLDKLPTDNLNHILKFSPKAVGDYMPPAVRTANKDSEAEFKKARSGKSSEQSAANNNRVLA